MQFSIWIKDAKDLVASQIALESAVQLISEALDESTRDIEEFSIKGFKYNQGFKCECTIFPWS